MKTYTFEEARSHVKITGSFGRENFLTTDYDLPELKFLTIGRYRASGPINGCSVIIPRSATGKIDLKFAQGGTSISIGRNTRCKVSIGAWRPATIKIGDGTTINECRIVADNSDVEIGEDCMFSDGIILESNDSHGLFDLSTGAHFNTHRRRIRLGRHVWLGRSSRIMPDVEIGDGAIIAASALVTKNVPPVSIFGGIPAKQIKSPVSWTRDPEKANASEIALFDELGFGHLFTRSA